MRLPWLFSAVGYKVSLLRSGGGGLLPVGRSKGSVWTYRPGVCGVFSFIVRAVTCLPHRETIVRGLQGRGWDGR